MLIIELKLLHLRKFHSFLFSQVKSSKLRAGIPQAQAEKEQSDVEEFSVR